MGPWPCGIKDRNTLFAVELNRNVAYNRIQSMPHRPNSLYVAVCHRCGGSIETEKTDTACPTCKSPVTLEWPAWRQLKPEQING